MSIVMICSLFRFNYALIEVQNFHVCTLHVPYAPEVSSLYHALKGLIKYTNVPSLVAKAQDLTNSEAGLQSRRILSVYSFDSDSGLKKSPPNLTPLRLRPSHRNPSLNNQCLITNSSPFTCDTILEAETAIQRLHVDVSIMTRTRPA